MQCCLKGTFIWTKVFVALYTWGESSCSAGFEVQNAMHLCLAPVSSLSSDNEIVCFLKVQLAEAINLQDKNQMAQIQETTRCVSHLDPRTCRKLLTAMAEDYRYTHYSLILSLS